MKTISKIGVAVLFVALAFSCKQAEAENAANEAPVTEESAAAKTADAAMSEQKNPKRKLIRTADIKFKVKPN